MKINIRALFAVFLLINVTVLVSCRKQASIDQALLSGRWTELQSVDQQGQLSNGVTTLSTRLDTVRRIDTIIFASGSAFIQISNDSIQGRYTDTSAYAITGDVITFTPPTSAPTQADVISLTSHQLVLKITTIYYNLYVNPVPLTITTITYIR